MQFPHKETHEEIVFGGGGTKKTRSFSMSEFWLLVKILTLDFDFIIMKKDLLHRSAEKGQISYSLTFSG